MSGAFCECLKCPGKVVCCCCKCALNMLFGFICTALVLIVIIGVILYFTVFKDSGKGGDDHAKTMQKLVETAPHSFRSLFKDMQQ